MDMNDIKKQLVEYAKLIEEKGFVNAYEGNISIVDRQNNLLYITPSGQRKLYLREEDIAVLKLDSGEQIEGLPRSSEYKLHRAALLARPDCGASIHSHTPFLTAFAFLNQELKMDCSVTFMEAKEVPCLPYGRPGTDDIHRGIEKIIANHKLINVANHGTLCVESDLVSCFALLEAMENTVKAWVIAQQFGKPARIPDYEALYAEIEQAEGHVQL